MAKVVWRTTPKSAYEWVEVDGGSTMSEAERRAFLDEYITDNGLVPVESDFVGETPIHRYGRYKADGAPAQALAPTSSGDRDGDLNKANNRVHELEAQVARLMDQLGNKPAAKRASMVDVAEGDVIGAAAGGQGTDEARAVLNTQDDVDIVASGQEVREDMSVADRSDDNPKRGPGRPKKA